MRSMVVSVLAPPGAHRGSLLPHNSSSSSGAATNSSHTRRHSLAAPVAASAREGGSSGSSRYANSRSSTQQDSDSSKKARSRHYYESTPKYKSRSSRADPDAAVTDAVADALSASFGDPRPTTSSSSGGHRSGKSSGSRGRPRGVSTADGYTDDLDAEEEEEEEEGRGWWEVPREQRWGSPGAASMAAADSADLQLEPWQEQQLLLAAASSKKKMQVQTVAANVGLDRTEVLAWVAAFRAKPKAEQARLLAPLQQQIQRMKAQQQAQADAAQEAEAVRRGRSPTQQQQRQQWQQDDADERFFQQQPQQHQQQQQQQQPGALPFSSKNPDTGFLPFSERRGSSSSSSGSRSKRLPGEVLRTLEGVYARSPWPNKEIVAGLFDLHRLPRDLVLDWFTARRQMDGLPDNPRAAKQLAATARRSLAADAPQPLLPADMLPAPRQQQQPKQQQAAETAEESAQPAGSTPAKQQQQARVQALTAKELAALRSGLPSPRKQKGEKLKQELGVKAGPEGSKQLEIAGVTFVAKDGRAGWRKVWRKRRSAAGLPAQQLDFNLWLLRQEEQQQSAAAAAAAAAAVAAGTDADGQGQGL